VTGPPRSDPRPETARLAGPRCDPPEVTPGSGDPGAPSERLARDLLRVEVDGREFFLLGTAHVSRESAEAVREAVAVLAPDAVCVELDDQRFQALLNPRRFEELDLLQVIRERQLATLILNLVLASYQKRLGLDLGVAPGTELLAAAEEARARGLPVALCDRDVRITLRRAWAALSPWRKLRLVSELLVSGFDSEPLGEEELRELRRRDVVSELMEELGRALPELKRVLIDERDAYLAQRIRETGGRRILAVVGAGHVAGMRRALEEDGSADLAVLETLPPPSPWLRLVGWAIPVGILGALLAVGLRHGAAAAGQSALYWIAINGGLSGLGAALALAHPVTVASAALAAPLTSLTPVIGVGYVAAFVQTWIRPPLVRELREVARDMAEPRRWWTSRLLRIFLVFGLSTLGSLAGTWLGGAEILADLFGGP